MTPEKQLAKPSLLEELVSIGRTDALEHSNGHLLPRSLSSIHTNKLNSGLISTQIIVVCYMSTYAIVSSKWKMIEPGAGSVLTKLTFLFYQHSVLHSSIPGLDEAGFGTHRRPSR